VLRSPILDGKRVLAPSGAPIKARLAVVLNLTSPRKLVVYGIRLESVEVNGRTVVLPARLLYSAPETQRVLRNSFGFLRNVSPQAGLFVFRGERVVTKPFDTDWITVTP